jgi:tetratricopeptide (TPR) repeat protein
MRPFRTVLEQKIRERRMTFEEFVAYAETYAREHREPGTLSVRHLQRLAAGRRSDGRPLGPVRPETARLLEHILGLDIDQLLAPPSAAVSADDPAADLRRKLDVARRIDGSIVAEFQSQLASIRRLDRQLGAVIAHDEVRTKIDQVANLLAHSVSGGAREQLAGLLSELYCLAGWQALDVGNVGISWRYYDHANTSALESEGYAFKMLASAGRAFVLIDIDKTALAVDVLTAACRTTDRKCSHLLRSWMSAALGEALAANGQQDESLRAFDHAVALLPTDTIDPDSPYVALDSVHLTRWRGHALAQCGMPAAIDVLSSALERLDRTFIRAETALRVDLATALSAIGERSEAQTQADHAHTLATRIGSTRQARRMKALVCAITH